ncbi:6-phospho-beta-glucosidase gmuD [Raoultella terrigena]|uniref:6-phospho-beta-glucosidase gmuD n=1 Tax=Raoultella terrigena TaxID=577 RepID=A0A4U9CYW6_RAOTE|nr:6-phospho-beta-glucosidase gmuD [Raoultella terrigena]
MEYNSRWVLVGERFICDAIRRFVDGDGKAKNIWDHWYNLEPNRFHAQIGPAETSTFYKNYHQDIL